MNKKTLYILFLFLALCSSVFAQAQNTYPSKSQHNDTSPIPNEQVFTHLNTSLFFVGEYLYYKIYVLNSKTENLSNLSKVAYLELINESKTSVFKHKIPLVSGTGQGDFFIPTTIPSGNYKIVSYTMNMLSKSADNYFQQDITIINPYRGNQSALKKNNSGAKYKTQNQNVKIESNITDINQISNVGLNIATDKSKYSKRSPVTIKFKNNNSQILHGDYSLSIRKLDTVSHTPLKRCTALSDNDLQNINSQNRLIIPELRGELLTGKITAISENQNLEKQKVALSIPGDNFIFKISNVDTEGNFYFNIDRPYSNNTIALQVLNDFDNTFEIDVNKQVPISFEKLDFAHFYIIPQMKKLIVDRSVYNQIENAYYSVKPDTVKTIPPHTSIYTKKSKIYNLDEYTRFPTMKETMVEIVNDAWIDWKNGKGAFAIREKDNSLRSNASVLLLVDGFFVQDHQKLIDYSANKVESIAIMQDKYYYGSQTFQGVMVVKTIEGDFYETPLSDYVKQVEVLPIQQKKKYFKQVYPNTNASETLKRVPDYRRQLLWLPDFKMTESSKEITCYTSDILGVYEIVIEGFSKKGMPIFLKETFMVE
ncbi:hypothetical protein [Marixanthomonas spongiae]|uniref:MG2 domain-containing protein n=1 Tax=Marixanthomonas spongiae TaxID=2174845 RepID=A0A2U0HYC9_9FLAO|nr:hypothetical protein [Marixanthomonas spongiae]PVW13873.1 hypothetical protein DDV96_12025 [Marixanthomonas spongiae]